MLVTDNSTSFSTEPDGECSKVCPLQLLHALVNQEPAVVAHRRENQYPGKLKLI